MSPDTEREHERRYLCAGENLQGKLRAGGKVEIKENAAFSLNFEIFASDLEFSVGDTVVLILNHRQDSVLAI